MRCNVCQTDNDPHARFCRQCGTALVHAAAPGPESLPPPGGGADPLWAQTVGSDAGGADWTEPVVDNRTMQNDVLPTIANGAVVRPVDFATAQSELRVSVAAQLAAQRRRRATVLVSLAAVVALVAGIVVAVLLLGGDDEGSVATETSVAGETTTSPVPETTVAATTTAEPATTVTSVGVTTVVTTAPATTVVVTTVVPTSAPATTVAPTTVPVTTAPPATTAPATTSPATTAPATTAPATTAPATSAPATTAAPSTSVAVPANGDLGLDRPISKPACDGKYITLIGSSVDPNGYAIQVESILDLYPDAKYLRTELVCSSLRAKSSAGNPIYVVYFGPFASKEQACRARDDGTDGAYVKVLDNTSNPGAGVACGD